MAGDAIGGDDVGPRQHGGGEVRHGGGMGADIGALVGEEDVVEGEDEAARVDRGADAVDLVARVVGGDEVLAAVLDPLDRPAEPERAERREHILRVDLAADAEAAADMALVEVELFERAGRGAPQGPSG